MGKEVKVKKLVIELSGKEVELTMAQAKELHAVLNELFGTKTTFVPQPYPVSEPWVRPWKLWRSEPWITWSGESPLYKTTAGTNLELEGSSLRCQLKS